MPDLGAEHFDAWFRELWGQAPFAWQRALVERVLGDDGAPWPEAIELPTGSGKTACLDIAIFTLAVEASRRTPRTALRLPRRVFFVVDRRIIVDEAFDRARRLARALREATGGVLKLVANELRELAGGDDPLAVHELRGGIYRSGDWARSPVQPMVICSTVDQVGSALLFRAYGSSWKTWPITAALVGNDSLILLDEAHCARPFLETVTAVRRYRGWAREPVGGPFHLVVMSATPPETGDVFRDTSGEPGNPEHPLGRRQLARKPIALRVAERAKRGREGTGVTAGTAQLAAALVEAAEELAAGGAKATVIFCNRVATARETHRLLAQRHTDNAILLTGRMRPVDKDDIVRTRLGDLASTRSETRRLEVPMFVVATQTLEVGADLDFDALVSECASLDALRQRFGRLNRMGRPIEARGVIVIRGDQVEGSEDDPVYGAALAKTWRYLTSLDSPDFGIAALASRLNGAATTELNAPAVSAPIMFPSHVDCWAQTAPIPEPTPDVALFLHGGGESTVPFVHVCWRGDLDLGGGGRSASLDVLAQTPPLAAECLPVPIGVFRAWLAGSAVPADESPDLEGGLTAGGSEDLAQPSARGRLAVLWRGRSEAVVIGVNEASAIVEADGAGEAVTLRPGDTVVLAAGAEAAVGEYQPLGDLPRVSDAVELDRGDEVFRRTRGRVRLRLYPALVRAWPESEGRDRLLQVLGEVRARLEEDPAALQEDVLAVLRQIPGGGVPGWVEDAVTLLVADSATQCRLHPVAGVILEGRKRVAGDVWEGSDFSDEDDAMASGAACVELAAHLRGVAIQARRFADRLGLSGELATVVEQAGAMHDLGKADPRFQALLNGGNRWLGDTLLAKSRVLPRGLRAFRRAREAAGYPQNGRHELLSVRLAESNEELLPRDPLQRDLLLHLIASHHGYCRPLAPVVVDDHPGEVRVAVEGRVFAYRGATGLERLDSGVADRYWRLVRHYGWWGLAWLEAVVRLADHRRSEAEEGMAE